MTSKAAKLTNKKKKRKIRIIRSGRPPERSVARTPSGAKSRSNQAKGETQKAIMATALNARISQAFLKDGEVLTEKEAKDPLRGYVAGRKYLNGDFGKGDKAKQLLQAGNDAAATWLKCKAICGYPAPTCKAMNIGKVRGLPIEPVNERERARIARNIMMGYERKLRSVAPGAKGLFLSVFLADDENKENLPAHMDALLIKSLESLLNG